MTRSPLTPTQKKKLMRLARKGKSAKYIAIELGEPIGRIVSFLSSKGIPSAPELRDFSNYTEDDDWPDLIGTKGA